MKKTVLKILAVMLVVASLTACLVACNKDNGNTAEASKATSYVTMDINPSVELVLDQYDKVMSVYAANEDAAVMFYSEDDLIGLTVEAASKKIVELAIEHGYVNVEVDAVNVTVSTTVDDKEDSVFVKVETALANVQVEVNDEQVSVSVIRSGDYITEIELENLIEGNSDYEGLTVAKYKLIKSAMAFDPTLTLEVAVTMTDAELIAIVEEGHNYFADKLDAECAKLIAAAERAYAIAEQAYLDSAYINVYLSRMLSLNFGRKYGAEYVIYTTLYNSVNAAINTIDDYLATPTVTSTDLSRISTALGIQAAQVEDLLADENGDVTRESISAYLNKEYKKCVSEEDRAIVKAHFEAVDAILTEIETAAQNVTAGEIASVSATVSACNSTIQSTYSLVLSAEQAALINEIATKFAEIRDIRDAESLLAYLENQIELTKVAMDNDLTDAERTTVENAIAARQAQLATARQALDNAISTAKTQAELRLQQLKEGKFIVDVTVD